MRWSEEKRNNSLGCYSRAGIVLIHSCDWYGQLPVRNQSKQCQQDTPTCQKPAQILTYQPLNKNVARGKGSGSSRRYNEHHNKLIRSLLNNQVAYSSLSTFTVSLSWTSSNQQLKTPLTIKCTSIQHTIYIYTRRYVRTCHVPYKYMTCVGHQNFKQWNNNLATDCQLIQPYSSTKTSLLPVESNSQTA